MEIFHLMRHETRVPRPLKFAWNPRTETSGGALYPRPETLSLVESQDLRPENLCGETQNSRL